MRRFFFVISLAVSAVAFSQENAAAKSIDDLWTKRDDPSALAQLKTQTDAFVTANPNDFEALWRAARINQWMADGETDVELKKKEGKEAWALGDRAVKANPKAVQGYYYGALGIGAYSQGAGILKALSEGLESKFNERLDTANKMDANWMAAGGLVAKGRYWWELPWPKRNLGKSKDMLNKAIATHPENLRAYVYLAETLLKDDKNKEALETVKKADTGDVAYDGPEGRRAKAMAKVVEAKIQEAMK